MICARCKTNPSTMVHARRLRKDGTYYEVKWCSECQRKRYKPVDRLNLAQRLNRTKLEQASRQSQQRILARLA